MVSMREGRGGMEETWRGCAAVRSGVRARLGDKGKATTGGFQSAQGYGGAVDVLRRRAGGAGCQRLNSDRPAELLRQVATTFCPSA